MMLSFYCWDGRNLLWRTPVYRVPFFFLFVISYLIAIFKIWFYVLERKRSEVRWNVTFWKIVLFFAFFVCKNFEKNSDCMRPKRPVIIHEIISNLLFLLTFLIKNFIKKRLQHRCFRVKFAKFLRTLILKNIIFFKVNSFNWLSWFNVYKAGKFI